MNHQYDLIVIGGGPGGYVAAIRAAQLGAKVALIEQDKVGGTCLNRGCIPTKALLACTNLFEQTKKAANFGVKTGEVTIDLKAVIERKNKIVDKIVKGVEFLLEKNKVEIIRGIGTVLSSGKVKIDLDNKSSLEVGCSNLILATGSSPIPLPGLNFDGKKILSSDDLLNCEQVPEKLDIVGGGVIGLHFAWIFSALGAQVTIHEALPEILPGIDEEIIGLVRRMLKRRKVEVLTNTRFNASQATGPTLICIGRKPNTPGITVNEKLETSTPGVYAVGDLVSKKQFAHVAYEQGVIAAENALGGDRTFSYDHVPYGIYTDPEIGAVGLTEKEARENHGEIKIGKFSYAALGIAQAMGEIEGFVKVIADKDGKLLGVHIIGAEANCLIASAVIALKNGLTIDQLANTFQAHPSFPEGLHEATLSALKRGLHGLN